MRWTAPLSWEEVERRIALHWPTIGEGLRRDLVDALKAADAVILPDDVVWSDDLPSDHRLVVLCRDARNPRGP